MKKIIPLIFLLFIIVGCGTTKYVEVPVDRVHTEYIYNTKLDSIFIHDSIYNHDSVIIYQRGDTIFKYKEKILYKYLIQNKYIDTSKVIEKNDTITKPIIVEKEVKVNYINWWQKTLITVGLATLLCLCGIIGFKYLKR